MAKNPNTFVCVKYTGMKTAALAKIFKNSLQDESNFNKELDANPQDVIANYKELVIEYYKFVNENIKVSNRACFEYIMNRGLDTITHVFNSVLYCTKNQEIVYYYAQKSIYLYIEFVNQISEIEKHFLQLTTRDATIYVYKKTIFDINIESRKKSDLCSHETIDKLNIIATNINVIKTVFMKLIQQGSNSNTVSNDNTVCNELFVSTINSIQVPSQNTETITNVIDALFYHVADNAKFCKLVCGLMSSIPTKKMKPAVINDDFLFRINEPTEVFLQWIFE